MDLRIDIVDDLKLDRERLGGDLRSYFASRSGLNCQLREFDSAESMLNTYTRGSSDIAFLDIQMNDITGIELAKRLRSADKDLLIIFVTTSRDYAFDAFPIHPFDYLIKPYTTERMREVLDEAMRALSAEEPIISIRVPRHTHDVPFNGVCAIEARGHTVEVHLTDGTTLRSIMTFTEVDKILSEDPRFLRCNRGVIVNMDQVARIENDVFKMRDGTIFPLRVRNRAALVTQFTQYTISHMERR